MGSLKPGATYVYERVDGVVYAREIGAPPESRFAMGWDYKPPDKSFEKWSKKFADEFLWNSIMEEAENNTALQKALENVKIIYYMIKEENGRKT
jgi:hypothetical protein